MDEQHSYVCSYPNLKLQQNIEISDIPDDSLDKDGGLHEARILQLSESDTHTCIRMPERTACVMNAGLEKDRSTGAILPRFNSDWLRSISRAGKLADLCSGDFFSCGILADAGQLACWGSSEACSTGICSPPAAEGGFAQLTCGTYHACALTVSDSRAICWGMNDDGMAQPPDGALQRISAGARHTCGIRFDGKGLCWGSNEGVGEYEGTLTWQATPPPIKLQEIAAGEMHTCGLLSQPPHPAAALFPPPSVGNIVCWGDNRRLQASPPNLLAVAIFAGSQHSCAVTAAEGRLVCWGDNAISRRYEHGQRGAAKPPESLTICSKRPRFFEVHYVGFRAISESFLHNVIDGASQVLLPAEGSPFTTPYLILSPPYLIIPPSQPSAPSSDDATPHESRHLKNTSQLTVEVHRSWAAVRQLRDARRGAAFEDGGDDGAHRLVVICFYGFAGGRVAGRAPVDVLEGGVASVSLELSTGQLSEGVHELQCVLAAGNVSPQDAESSYLSFMGGNGAVFVSSVSPSIDILSPLPGATFPLPLPSEEGEEMWADNHDDMAESGKGGEVVGSLVVSVDLELKVKGYQKWGECAAVHVRIGGHLASIIQGPGSIEASPGSQDDSLGDGDADGSLGVLHVGGVVKGRLQIFRGQGQSLECAAHVQVDMVDGRGRVIPGGSASVHLFYRKGEGEDSEGEVAGVGMNEETLTKSESTHGFLNLGSRKVSPCRELYYSPVQASSGGAPRICTLPHVRRRQSLLISDAGPVSMSSSHGNGTKDEVFGRAAAATCSRSRRVGGFWHIFTLASDWAQQARQALDLFAGLPAVNTASAVLIFVSGPFADVVAEWIYERQRRACGGGLREGTGSHRDGCDGPWARVNVKLRQDMRGETRLAYEGEFYNLVLDVCSQSSFQYVWVTSSGLQGQPGAGEE